MTRSTWTMATDSDSYRQLLTRLDAWFAAARREAAGIVPCREGCTACCHGPFDISVADAELIGEALDRMPTAARAGVTERAQALLARMHALEPGWSSPYAVEALGEERFDRLTEALADEPLLDETGRCGIYADRPLVCRMIGHGMRTRAGRTIENACPIQERFPGYASLPPAMFELEAFEEVELACLRDAAARRFGDAGRWGFETTIAAAILIRRHPERSEGPAPRRSSSG
jgi:Fe-S-cluster containining protein